MLKNLTKKYTTAQRFRHHLAVNQLCFGVQKKEVCVCEGVDLCMHGGVDVCACMGCCCPTGSSHVSESYMVLIVAIDRGIRVNC